MALFAACAADPGDGPKGDGGPSVSQGPAEAAAVPDAAPYQGTDAPEDTFTAPTDSTVSDDAEVPDAAGPPIADAPPDVPSCTTCAIELKYLCATTTDPSQEIRPHYDIYNNGSSTQSLTELTVRYYFTADGSQTQAYNCDYAQVGCGFLQATFVAMPTPTATADHYMELSFTGGSIAAGSHSGEMQNRFHDTNYQGTFMQSNDYSFDPSKTQYADWDHVTVYRNGTLIWGVEP